MTALPIRPEPRILNQPKPGFWLMKLRKGAPEVPAAIMWVHTTHEPGNPDNLMERSPFLAAFIAGEPVSLNRVWESRGRPISETEYRYLLADLEWVRQYAPTDPKANPRQKVDLSTMAPPF